MKAKRPRTVTPVRRLRVPIHRLPHAEGLPLPAYQSDDAAGLDLVAALPADKPVVLSPGERDLIPTGLTMALPRGHEAQVRPRSGLALKHGVTVLNSPGTIDADYRGEVKVILVNLGRDPFEIRRGERIAQLVVQPVVRADLVLSVALDATVRGSGGFGSTGRAASAGGEAPAGKPPGPPSGARSKTKGPKTPAKRTAARR